MKELVIELANSLDSLLESLIITQPAAYLGHLFVAEAKLSRASCGITNGEDPGWMTFAAGTFRTTAPVADEAVEE